MTEIRWTPKALALELDYDLIKISLLSKDAVVPRGTLSPSPSIMSQPELATSTCTVHSASLTGQGADDSAFFFVSCSFFCRLRSISTSHDLLRRAGTEKLMKSLRSSVLCCLLQQVSYLSLSTHSSSALSTTSYGN